MWATLRISEQADSNMTVHQIQYGLRTICSEASKLQEEAELDTMPPMSKFLFRSTDRGLDDHCQVLHVYGGLFTALTR